eukprot:GHRR01021445.1.p1 GENE.GHRR01021445.1~~GHRR01021445.1.p1  ORF type:complete len:276 (+),score=25.11 GHRR01021445.1:689-1516(+)
MARGLLKCARGMALADLKSVHPAPCSNEHYGQHNLVEYQQLLSCNCQLQLERRRIKPHCTSNWTRTKTSRAETPAGIVETPTSAFAKLSAPERCKAAVQILRREQAPSMAGTAEPGRRLAAVAAAAVVQPSLCYCVTPFAIMLSLHFATVHRQRNTALTRAAAAPSAAKGHTPQVPPSLLQLHDSQGHWHQGVHSMVMEVRDYEMDQFQVVNNAVYASYVQHGRHKAFQSLNMPVEQFQQQGTLMALSELSLHYKAPLRAGDTFYVTTAMAQVGR